MSDDDQVDDPSRGEAPDEVLPPAAPPGPGDHEVSQSPESMRLRRSRDHRVIAGVCSGIAQRFDVNENLVRVIFVVLTLFYGLGAAIYLVMWVIVRSAVSDSPAGSRREPTPVSTSHRLTIAVVAALVVLAVLAVGVAHPLHPVRLLGPSLALAWIVFLMVLAIIAIGTPARRVTLRRVAGITFLAGTSFVIVVVGAAMGFLDATGVSLAGGSGERVWQPTMLTQVTHGYHSEFGVSTLDVSAVDFPTSGFAIQASVAAGELRIVVPANAVVNLSTVVGVGVVVVDSPISVPGVSTEAFASLPARLSASQIHQSPHLTIDARVGWGQIDLMRALPRSP